MKAVVQQGSIFVNEPKILNNVASVIICSDEGIPCQIIQVLSETAIFSISREDPKFFDTIKTLGINLNKSTGVVIE